MKEQNIGAAVFTSIHNIAYYSNYVYCSMGRPYALVVTHDSQTSVSALVDGGQPWRRWLLFFKDTSRFVIFYLELMGRTLSILTGRKITILLLSRR